jgi:hypothetical protein
MTLWHIDDFRPLTDTIPRPWPWNVIGVMPTADDYLRLGDSAYDQAFCYTVSTGPAEVWVPMMSIERRFCPPEAIAEVVNVLFTAVGAKQLADGDNIIVPFEYASDVAGGIEQSDGVFWIGSPVEDPDHSRFHCYRSPNDWVLPVRWSSPQGWPDE